MSTDIRTFFKSEPISSFKKIEHLLHRLDTIGANPKIIKTFQNILDCLEENQTLIARQNSTNKEAISRDVDTNLSTVIDEVRSLSSEISPEFAQPAKKKCKLN